MSRRGKAGSDYTAIVAVQYSPSSEHVHHPHNLLYKRNNQPAESERQQQAMAISECRKE